MSDLTQNLYNFSNIVLFMCILLYNCKSFELFLTRFVMHKIIVIEEGEEIVLLDTDNIQMCYATAYFENLSYYKKLDEALALLNSINEKENWKPALLSKLLQKKKIESEDMSLALLSKSLFQFSHPNKTYSGMLPDMTGLSCYRVGADAGAGFKAGDLDILGTEGILECVGVLVETSDVYGQDCYYLAHVFSGRKTELSVQEELDRIFHDIKKLTEKNLSWSDLKHQVTLVSCGSFEEKPSDCCKQLFKLLLKQKVKPNVLFGNSVAFNLTGIGDLIILNPDGSLVQGNQAKIPRVGHGTYSPVDILNYRSSNKPSATLDEQIKTAIDQDEYPYEKSSSVFKQIF